MRLGNILALIICYSVLLQVPASAGQLSLKEALKTAFTHNPRLSAYRWSLSAQKEQVEAERGRRFPTLRVEERFSRTNNPTYGFMAKLNQERFTEDDFRISSLNDSADISDFQTALVFAQTIYAPGISLGIGMSQNEMEAKTEEYKRLREEVALQVVRAFLTVQTSREHLIAARSAEHEAGEHKRLAEMRQETGTGLYSDVLRAEVAVKRAEARRVSAEGNLQIAKRNLGLLLGGTEPVDVGEEKPLLPVPSIEFFLNTAQDRGDLKAVELRRENSVKAVKLERSFYVPEIKIEGRYNLYDHKDPFSPEGESYLLTGFLRWNLFDIVSYHRVKEAGARVRETEDMLSGLRKEIHFRIHEAHIRAGEKEKHLALARSVVDESEEALRLVRARYENALSPIIDLLDTQVMLDQARADLIQAESEYMYSVVVLYHQSGSLLHHLDGE